MVEPIEFGTTVGDKNFHPVDLLPNMANRHGCISGATGTGKTVSLQKLAESFSKRGVPVFLADIKGDLSGISKAAQPTDKLKKRLEKYHLQTPDWSGCPVVFWDVFGEQGIPVRATISDMGPLLLSRLLQLNETQEGVLNATFAIADDNGLLLLDLKDLRSMLQFVAENADQFRNKYGNISSASIGAIQRGLLQLEKQGADKFFGEPMLNIMDLIQTEDGKGVVNILAADKLMQAPKLYATFLLWILSELFENLPEVGDLEKPKLVFFFDEAHMLFRDAPAALVDKVEQVVRLIRSKGVGVYFVSQSPMDMPEKVLGQLGNRVQHALRAFTPRDQKAVKTVGETMRPNPAINMSQAIQDLGVGEALVSFLDDKGSPSITERIWVGCPGSQIGPISEAERKELIKQSGLTSTYGKTVDRESAYEMLQKNRGQLKQKEENSPQQQTRSKKAVQEEYEEQDEPGMADAFMDSMKTILFGTTGPRGGHKEGIVETMAKRAIRQSTDKIIRGVLGSIFKGGR